MAALAFVALLSCDMTGPTVPLPGGAMRLAVPAEYQAWWTRTEACSGITGTLDDIRWYVVPDATGFPTSAGPEVGRWSHGSNGVEIVLAGAYQDHEMVVRHEMLHALLGQSGHPTEFFVDRCHLTWDSWRG